MVDADLAVREALRDAFEMAGFEVEAVADGVSGFQAVARTPARVALVDVGAAGSAGWSTLKVLCDLGSIPVVAMGVRRGLGKEAKSVGAAGYWEKPLPLAEVIDGLRRLALGQSDRVNPPASEGLPVRRDRI